MDVDKILESLKESGFSKNDSVLLKKIEELNSSIQKVLDSKKIDESKYKEIEEYPIIQQQQNIYNKLYELMSDFKRRGPTEEYFEEFSFLQSEEDRITKVLERITKNKTQKETELLRADGRFNPALSSLTRQVEDIRNIVDKGTDVQTLTNNPKSAEAIVNPFSQILANLSASNSLGVFGNYPSSIYESIKRRYTTNSTLQDKESTQTKDIDSSKEINESLVNIQKSIDTTNSTLLDSISSLQTILRDGILAALQTIVDSDIFKVTHIGTHNISDSDINQIGKNILDIDDLKPIEYVNSSTIDELRAVNGSSSEVFNEKTERDIRNEENISSIRKTVESILNALNSGSSTAVADNSSSQSSDSNLGFLASLKTGVGLSGILSMGKKLLPMLATAAAGVTFSKWLKPYIDKIDAKFATAIGQGDEISTVVQSNMIQEFFMNQDKVKETEDGYKIVKNNKGEVTAILDSELNPLTSWTKFNQVLEKSEGKDAITLYDIRRQEVMKASDSSNQLAREPKPTFEDGSTFADRRKEQTYSGNPLNNENLKQIANNEITEYQTVDYSQYDSKINNFHEKAYNESVGQKESQGNYNIKSSVKGSSAAGKYQMTDITRQDLGYMDESGNYTGKDGINSLDDWLNSPKVQEKAQAEYNRRNKTALEGKTIEVEGKSVPFVSYMKSLGMTDEAIVAGAHFQGAGGFKRYMQARQKYIEGDRSDEVINDYVKYGSDGYLRTIDRINQVNEEFSIPTGDGVEKPKYPFLTLTEFEKSKDFIEERKAQNGNNVQNNSQEVQASSNFDLSETSKSLQNLDQSLFESEEVDNTGNSRGVGYGPGVLEVNKKSNKDIVRQFQFIDFIRKPKDGRKPQQTYDLIDKAKGVVFDVKDKIWENRLHRKLDKVAEEKREKEEQDPFNFGELNLETDFKMKKPVSPYHLDVDIPEFKSDIPTSIKIPGLPKVEPVLGKPNPPQLLELDKSEEKPSDDKMAMNKEQSNVSSNSVNIVNVTQMINNNLQSNEIG